MHKDFPILLDGIHYLDSAATTQKPHQVIDAVSDFYKKYNANVGRSTHTLSGEANRIFEDGRNLVKEFINAKRFDEIIFTKNTTDGINLVANILLQNLKDGDEIILSELEHHSNIVPWQIIAKKKNLVIKYIKLNTKYELDMDHYLSLISEKTKVVSINYISNVLGCVNPVKEIINIAKKHGAYTVIDCAQAMTHLSVDVQELDVDFACFSGHKMYAPNGIGVMYGKHALLKSFNPIYGGGGMVTGVSEDSYKLNSLPYCLEPGTQDTASVYGLIKAIEYIKTIGYKQLQLHDNELQIALLNMLKKYPEVEIIGPSENRVCIISFTINNIHSHDIAEIFNSEGIYIRSGHCCCSFLMNKLNINGVARISTSIYNNTNCVNAVEKAIKKCIEIFK